jgi:hypothetical protein
VWRFTEFCVEPEEEPSAMSDASDVKEAIDLFMKGFA